MNSALIEKQTIQQDRSLKEALEKLNNVPDNLTLFVLNSEQQVVGALTDGDIRRGLLKGLTIEEKVEQFMFSRFRYLNATNFTLDQVKELKAKRIKLVPMVDEQMHLLRLIDLINLKSVLPLDVIIMAGGKGERLKPLTDNIPKPLLKVGDVPILEHNLKHISSFGINNVYLSINYLGQMISEYFSQGNHLGLHIKYINETKPLGTLGAASLIEDFEHDNVLVMNADVLTNIDLEDFYNEHILQNANMSVASVPYKVSMPFAVLETSNNRVLAFREKPEYTYYTNAGIYLINRRLISLLPKNTHYHATDLMQEVINRNEKLIQYTIHGFWMDIGRKEDFERAQTEIKHLYSK